MAPPFFIGLFGGGPSGPPAAPTLTAPADNTEIYQGQVVTVAATTTDGDLDQLEWVIDPGTGGETVVASDASSPYSSSWVVPGSLATGAHTMVARAWRGGLYTDSAPIDLFHWSPALLTSLKLWLRADTGVTHVAGAVSAWAPKGGDSSTCTQGTEAAKPTYSDTSGPGGTRPGISFDAGDYLSGTMTGWSAGDSGSIVIVGKLTDTSNRAFIDLNDTNTTANRSLSVLSAGATTLYGRAANGSGTSDVIGTNVVTGAWKWWTFIHRTAQREIRQNGTLMSGTNPAVASRSILAPAHYRVGGLFGGTPLFGLLGSVSDVIATRAELTAGERTSLAGYMQHFWGIT